ncbi:hypothetical protein ACOMHN_015661 [Nucella lapillus]
MKLDLVFLAAVYCIVLVTRNGWAAAAAAASEGTGGRGAKVALLIIDVQDCFLARGSLAVPDGEQVIPVINRIRRDHEDHFSVVAVSQDWHCRRHVSFASQHPGADPYSVVNLTYNSHGELCYGNSVPYNFPYAVNCSGGSLRQVSQTMWPDHCIQNVTSGPNSAEFSPSLTMAPTDVVVRKGDSCGIDSYSAFYDNGGFHQTSLDGILKARDIGVVVVTGLALDFCVYYTSKDAHTLGYKVLTVTDACRGVKNSSTEAALQDMGNTGVELIESKQLGETLRRLTSAAGQFIQSPFVYLLLLATIVVTSVSWQ